MNIDNIVDFLKYDTKPYKSMFKCAFECVVEAYEFIEKWQGHVDSEIFYKAVLMSEERCLEIAGADNEPDSLTYMQYEEVALYYIAYGLKEVPLHEVVPVMEYLCDWGGFDLSFFILTWNPDVNPSEVTYWCKTDYIKEEVREGIQWRKECRRE